MFICKWVSRKAATLALEPAAIKSRNAPECRVAQAQSPCSLSAGWFISDIKCCWHRCPCADKRQHGHRMEGQWRAIRSQRRRCQRQDKDICDRRAWLIKPCRCSVNLMSAVTCSLGVDPMDDTALMSHKLTSVLGPESAHLIISSIPLSAPSHETVHGILIHSPQSYSMHPVIR